MTKERRLGRGLQALLGGLGGGDDAAHEGEQHEPQPLQVQQHAHDEDHAPHAAESGVILLGVFDIDDNPFQPRRQFSEPEIASLAESLKEHDMLQPIMVRRVGERFQLIAGERRLRAAIQAGWSQVPAQVREADDRLVAELAIVENLQRQDLNPIEKALSFQRYIQQHECTQEDLARRIKVDRATIANLMRLLELPEDVKTAICEKKITAGHARALLPLGDEQLQLSFCRKIQNDGLSVRATEQAVREKIDQEDAEQLSIVGQDGTSRPVRRPRPAHLTDLEQQLRIALGTKIEIRQSGKKRGKIVIHFSSEEEFQRIRGQLTDRHREHHSHGG